MKIKYLGTAAAEGWPGVFCACEACKKARKNGGNDIRTRSSALINDSLMVDFPPDSYYHAIKFGIDLSELKHLVITHSHEDHFYPDDLALRRSVFAHLEDSSVLDIYGNKAVNAIMAELLALPYDLSKYIKSHMVPPFETFKAGDIKVTPLLALHNRKEDCYIYIFEDKDGKCILYGNDTGIFPEATWEYIEGYHFDLVSLDCTMGPRSDGNNHMGIPDNIKVKDRLNKIGCADDTTKFILTHFSHNGGLLYDELVEAARPHGFEIAYDGFEVEF
jgi:phosphoribosyl 1,2-cyclic phosphate phosphodiesterase